MTSTTADARAEVSWLLTSRGGWTRTRHNTPTMTMAAEEGSNLPPNRMMVAYSEATATTAGTTAWTPVNMAMRKLCFSRTGWVILNPLEPAGREFYFWELIRGATCALHYRRD